MFAIFVWIYLFLCIFCHFPFLEGRPQSGAQNEFKCIRLNEPPYFYCNLPNNRNREISSLQNNNNEKEEYPIYPFQATTTAFPLTTESLIENKELPTTITPIETFPIQTESSNIENVFPSTPKKIMTFIATSGFTTTETSTLSDISVTKNLDTTTMIPKEEETSSIITELLQSPPTHHGQPSLMEEIFIDTLTKSTQDASSSIELFRHSEYLNRSNRQLFFLCRRFLPFAREHCHREFTLPQHWERCRGYFQDCETFILRADPLQEATRALNYRIRYDRNGNPFPFQTLPTIYS